MEIKEITLINGSKIKYMSSWDDIRCNSLKLPFFVKEQLMQSYNVDYEYKKLVETILSEGEERKDRTGVGTIGVFGYQYKIDLRLGFPLLTTKKINLNSIFHELTWFLRGETNVNTLKAPQLWKPWADKDGRCGPIYGSQWVNWKTYIEESYIIYDGDPVNQIQNLIKDLTKNPFSRRHILSAWNVAELDDMALPPCHILSQFYVSKDGFLDCQMYQRSMDTALGAPFNIASYSLLQILLARECKLIPRYFIHSIGDAHIYLNHIDRIKEQILREPRGLPRLEIQTQDDFWTIVRQDDPDTHLKLSGYNPHPFIKFEVAV